MWLQIKNLRIEISVPPLKLKRHAVDSTIVSLEMTIVSSSC
ncbi:MAG: hypothetical protein WAV16_04420 [Candidatus Moraniibacteriota bacterium]